MFNEYQKIILRKRKIPIIIILLICTSFIFLGIAIFAPVISPQDPTAQNLLERLKPPVFLGGTNDYKLGTDQLGRDSLSRLIIAIRTTFLVAVLGAFLGAVLGVSLGILSGLSGSFVDTVIMFLVDVRMALPFTLIALVAASVFGPGFVVLIFAIAVGTWAPYARLVRAQVLSLRNQPFIEASRALGATRLRIAIEHIFRNVTSVVIVYATFNLSEIVLLESVMSFLGLGIQPPDISLGLMVNQGRHYLITSWWLSVIPSVVIFLMVLQFALLGDWLRDKLDPRLID